MLRLDWYVLLAIDRLNANAYGVTIRDEVKTAFNRDYSFGSIYAALDRLKVAELVDSAQGESTAVRGNRRKLIFTITMRGKRILKEHQ